MLLQIRKSMYAKMASLLLILTLALYTNQGLFASKQTVKIHDGKELFGTIFFMDGQLLKELPSMREYNIENVLTGQAELQKYREHIGDICAKIEASNPNFFDAFAKDLTSGDQVRIRTAIDNGLAVLQKANNATLSNTQQLADSRAVIKNYNEYVKKNKLPLESKAQKVASVKMFLDNLKGQGAEAQAAGFVLAVGIVIVVAVVVTAAVAVDGAFWFSTPAYRTVQTGSLQYEEIVNEIAVKFNGSYKKG
jgi:SdpC family antimicrobial peptide